MGRPKIQNENEAIRWMEEGKTYNEIIELYRTKYNIETSQSMWAAFRRRRGLDRRTVRDDSLIPWAMKREHRWLFAPKMLRLEAKLRAGKSIDKDDKARLDSFKERLKTDGRVVHYEPDTKEGWFYVPAREGIDTDLIRVPDSPSTERPSRH
ncbi:hypothetical protein CLV30_106152 [Haloactinopolyspora alba]|uniref:Immunity repressor n=1 Tax=Haloactinopolyspora alba TaxID=648780 RepID=A0A2P8E3Z5_9ACTN|nr:hypothetical protein [Haloactinopolyspora alba]PSL04147.1 hypothetical protein CLV30_106152 [Haloactinopolyspora alba]